MNRIDLIVRYSFSYYILVGKWLIVSCNCIIFRVSSDSTVLSPHFRREAHQDCG